MAGSAVVRLDGLDIAVTRGDGVFVPIGARHRVTNPHDEPAEFAFHLSPLAPRPELGHVDTEPQPGTGPALWVGSVTS